MDLKKIFNILPIKSGRISMLNYRNAVKIQYQVLQNHLFVKFSHGSIAPPGQDARGGWPLSFHALDYLV